MRHFARISFPELDPLFPESITTMTELDIFTDIEENISPEKEKSSADTATELEADTAAAIEVRHLCHRYGATTIYEDLNFTVPKGTICGLLGKNGQGKTTLVNILMGFLKPVQGSCLVLGEHSHILSPQTRARIGLLHEGHLAYDFMTIAESERFYSSFYPNWQEDRFYDLVNRMGLPMTSRLNRLSCGQRSQVVLGLIMAQNPDLLILDDFSLGLDAGYRRLFLEVLHEFFAQGGKTIFVTSHIVQDLENLIDSIIFIDFGRVRQTGLREFMTSFHRYEWRCPSGVAVECDHVVKGVERRNGRTFLYSFAEQGVLANHLESQGRAESELQRQPMTLEDGFIGLLGQY
jgi:ABC-2 type transport system ATP-binding protein